MSIKKYKPEQIVVVLRQIEVQIANGKTPPQACKEAGIHTQTYYRWRKEYGGLKVVQAKRLKELEKENGRLKRLVAELSLEKQVLRDVARGNFYALSGVVVRWSMRGSNTSCQNGMPAGCWGNGEGHNDTSRILCWTKMPSPERSLLWRRSTGATGTEGSRRCCGVRAGKWARTECSESGGGRG